MGSLSNVVVVVLGPIQNGASSSLFSGSSRLGSTRRGDGWVQTKYLRAPINYRPFTKYKTVFNNVMNTIYDVHFSRSGYTLALNVIMW